MYSKNFDIDFNRLIVSLLPPALRKPTLYSMLYCLIKPIISIYNTFVNQRTKNLYFASITPQVCQIRKLLNDTFDPNERRIYITDGQTNEWTIVYSYLLFNPNDGKQPLWISPNDYNLISSQVAVSTMGYDFVVMVPWRLNDDDKQNSMVSLINTYKLASKRYIINYY